MTIHPRQSPTFDHSACRVGLVVPSYGYANFLPEMASSILGQANTVPAIVVLVDDCDPDPSIVALCQTYAAAYPDLFHYIRPRQNGGLSAARNIGVSYLLDICPTLEMVMFPDADDRMLPGFVQKSYDAFCAAREATERDGERLGWVFENPNIFGHAGYMTRLTQHSRLWNMVGATQMPSSALSAEMYRAGLRYDETMTWGGEDWEFSIRALNAGFVGKYGGDLGFHWRRRPGSMSSSVLQDKAREHNRTLIRLRNKALFQREAVWARRELENSAYCLLEQDGWRASRSVSDLVDTIGVAHVAEGGGSDPFVSLARQLTHAETYPADPCPQSFYVAAPLAKTLAPERLRNMAYWSEILAAHGAAVTHTLASDTGAFVPHVAPFVGPDARDVLEMRPKEQVMLALKGRPAAGNTHLRVTWPADPSDPAMSEDGGAMSCPDTCSDTWDKALHALCTCGYRYDAPKRYFSRPWRPQALTWRSLPGFLIGLRDQVVADMACLERKILLTDARYVADLCRRLPEWDTTYGLADIDIMVVVSETQGFYAPYIRKLHTLDAVGQVHIWNKDLNSEVDLTFVALNILGLYGEVVHWRSTEFSDHLGWLKKVGVTNALMVTRADTDAQILNANSMFKCYDRYDVVDAADEGYALMAAHGIPRQRLVVGRGA